MKLEELRLLLAEATVNSKFWGKCYFAGGCVRDQLLGRSDQVLDADIAVELSRGGIALARFLAGRYAVSEPKAHPAFGTAKLTLEGIQLEFVMTRSERYQPENRFPRVSFAPLSADCLRRDFTVNAFYQRISDADILDPCTLGQQDLHNRLIRCVRNPHTSFKEDPLRLLRALRFAAVLDFELEAQTLAAIRDLAPLVRQLSQARCQSEKERLNSVASPQQLDRWQDLAKSTGIGDHLPNTIAST